jgi:hypothetical protein
MNLEFKIYGREEQQQRRFCWVFKQMNSKLLLLSMVLFISHCLVAQFRIDKRDHYNNYIDPIGRKQGFWTIKDADSLLFNKARYSNNIADTIVYFKKDGASILLFKPDSNAYPINYVELDKDERRSITLDSFNTGCNPSVSYLIEASGQVSEIRFLNRCSKKIEKRIRRYLSPLAFNPAKLNGKSIVSQSIFRFGKSY